MTAFADAAALLSAGVSDGAYPAACAEVGRHDEVLWRASAGRLTWDPDSPPAAEDTIFDLASLTKVLATTTLVMRAVDAGALSIDELVGELLRGWRGRDREQVTIRDLLEHASGLPAYLPFFRDHTGRAEFEAAICRLPLEYEPRTQSIYSDLGFMLLGFIVEDARADRTRPGRLDPSASLAAQFRTIATYVTSEPLLFNPSRDLRSRMAPTEAEEWRGRTLVGEVHDENTWALGGAAGHAGLFGTAGAVGAFARAALLTIRGAGVLAHPDTMHTFIRRGSVPGSSRALGWDTMLPTSSCGTRMSRTAIGHTGFTGTSLWIDWQRDAYVVLLTNRVHPTRDNDKLRGMRPAFHDAVMAEIV